MSDETKAAAAEAASKNSEKEESATPKKEKKAPVRRSSESEGGEKKPAKSSKKEDATSSTEDKPDGSGGKTEKKFKYKNPFSYRDPLQTKVVNCIMKNGKKTLAQRILKDTFDELSRKGQKNPIKTFELAFANVKPSMETKAKRIGGAVYQIPMEVTPKRQETLSVRWILEGARKKKGMPMYRRLALELIDAANESGYAFSKKEEVHKMAQANKAFAHLARY